LSAFEVRPVSLSNGRFAAAKFDDAACTWDDERLRKPLPLAAAWQAPKLRLLDPNAGPTPVLFSPVAHAVSPAIRSSLAACTGLEFLPIDIAGFGTFFVIHVVAAADAPPGTRLRRAPPPSGNIVEVFSLPDTFSPPADFFRIRQPRDSAAGAVGSCLKQIYVGPGGAQALDNACWQFLQAKKMTSRSR
jgi:hypothetical protein